MWLLELKRCAMGEVMKKNVCALYGRINRELQGKGKKINDG
jgi:hypothetical protein